MPAKHLLTRGLVTLSIIISLSLIAQHVSAAPTCVSSQQLTFTQNDGQWASQIKYRTDAPGATVWLAADGAYYQFFQGDLDNEPENQSLGSIPEVMCLMVKATFVGASSNTTISGENETDYRSNYFFGSNPQRWQTDVPGYESVVYSQVYPGIDLKYYGDGHQLEYDFILQPGADPTMIRIAYEGNCDLLVNDNGELVVTTAYGAITEARPYVYQVIDDEVQVVDGSYQLVSENTFGFEIDWDDYDPNYSLIIDPVLTYSTYLGGTGADYLWGLDIDDEGNAYVAGLTNSADFPTVNALQEEFAGTFDLFLSKLCLTGDTLLWSTYLGGNGREENPRLKVDGEGNIILSGRVFSLDFPMVNAYMNTLQGFSDAFVTKFNPEGNQIIFSSYLGGSADDCTTGMDVDTDGNIYLCGYTESVDFPTFEAFNSEQLGVSDAFVTILDVSGSYLIFSSFLGGGQDETPRGIKVDNDGCVYVCGETTSNDFPILHAIDSTQDGFGDGFVTKFAAGCQSLVFSTYMGGTDDDGCTGIGIDSGKCVYVSGYTMSSDLPVVNAYQDYHAGGGTDIFLSKFNYSGDSLLYSTYLGGSDLDFCYGIAVSPTRDVFVAGGTYSVDFPTQAALFETYINKTDAFITRFDASGEMLSFSTFFNGSYDETIRTVVVDDDNNAWVVGYTVSDDLPVENAYQDHLTGSNCGFVAWIENKCCIGTRGNFNGSEDDLCNLMDLLYALEWMFADGPAPNCFEEADINTDGRVNGLDLVYMVSYMFNDGAPPKPCPLNMYGL